MTSIGEMFEDLEQLAPAMLRARWQAIFRREVPPLSTHLLRRQIAWRLQERKQGGLSRSAINELKGLEEGTGKHSAADRLPIGTRLVRDWNGHRIEVLVLEDGYRFEDRQFRSLSQIARHVTGAHWSGPRFFGLKNGQTA